MRANDGRQPSWRQPHTLELPLVLAAFIGVVAASAAFQRPVSANGGGGWDGVAYIQMAAQLANGERPSADAPFVYRLGTPFLVSRFFSDDPLRGFRIVNTVATLIASLLLVLWLGRYVSDWKVRTLLLLLFMVNWVGPVRFVQYYPASVDPWLLPVLLGGLLLIHSLKAKPTVLRFVALGVLVAVGVLFREGALVLAVCGLFTANPVRAAIRGVTPPGGEHAFRWPPPAAFIPLGLGCAALLTTRLVAVPTTSYSFLREAAYMTYAKPLPAYIHGWFVAYGLVIVLVLYDWRRAGAWLAREQALAVFLASCAVIGWSGGEDTERLLGWAAPVVYLMIGRSMIENPVVSRSPWVLGAILGSQLLSERVFWAIPDHPNDFSSPVPILSVLTSRANYLDLWSYHGHLRVTAVSLAQYLLLSALLLWWLKSRQATLDVSATPPAAAAMVGGERVAVFRDRIAPPRKPGQERQS